MNERWRGALLYGVVTGMVFYTGGLLLGGTHSYPLTVAITAAFSFAQGWKRNQ